MSDINQEEYTQEKIDSKRSEKATHESNIRNLEAKIARLETAKDRIEDNMGEVRGLKKNIEKAYEYLADNNKWIGKRKNEMCKMAENDIYSDCSSYYLKLDSQHDAICDKICELLKLKANEENIIEKIVDYIQVAKNNIEKYISY